MAENKSPRAVHTYMEALQLLGEFLAPQGMPTALANVKREYVEAFIADLPARQKSATTNNRYRALQAFFKWAVEEGEIKTSPMARIRTPRAPARAARRHRPAP